MAFLSRIYCLRLPIALAVILISAYSLAYRGATLGSGDEIIRYLMTVNFVNGNGFTAEYTDRDAKKEIYGSQVRPKFGSLHPFLAVPFYFASFPFGQTSRDAHDIMLYEVPANAKAVAFVLWFNPFMATLLCLAFYATGRRMRYGQYRCFWGVLALGLGSIVFAYTPTFFTEIFSALLLLSAVGLSLGQSTRDRFLCGACCGFLGWNNSVFVVTIPVFIADLVIQGDRRMPWRRLVPFVLGTVPGLAALVYHYVSLGGTGYSHEKGFTTPLLIGLYGNLLSPGKSLFLFSPACLVSLFGWRRFYTTHRRSACTSAILTVIVLLVYSKWYNWAGGTCWGPRFLIPIVPLVMLGIFEVDLSAATMQRRFLVVSLLGFSVLVQILALLPPAYSWFHVGANSLHVTMANSSASRQSEDDRILAIQTTLPYFPELCPVLIQGRTLFQILREERFDAMSPCWIQEKRIGWGGAASLLIAALATSVFISATRENRRNLEAEEKKGRT